MGGIVVVSAHLDDAVLSCYGVLAPSVTVVTALAGFPPAGTLGAWDAAGGATDSRKRIAERRAEDVNALVISGAEPIHLDFPESQYVWGGAIAPPPFDSVAASLHGYLEGATTVFAPSALSANRWPQRLRRPRDSDHRFVRDVVLAIRPDATLYADIPYALRRRTGGFSLPRDLDASRRLEHRMHLDDDLVAMKAASVRCYVTQLAQLTGTFGDFINPRGVGLEVYWAASPASTP
jgi:LmbE family N-acetylglucosaminyl deacetylase